MKKYAPRFGVREKSLIMQELHNNTCAVTKISINPDVMAPFADWQAKLNEIIAAQNGFLSLEILSPASPKQPWIIVQRFQNAHSADNWMQSKQRKHLFQQLKSLLTDAPDALIDNPPDQNNEEVVTQVFVTKVSPDKLAEYSQWIAKIHQVEAKFPGFKGVYVQSPNQGESENWITLLRFDTKSNLDRWLNSEERRNILKESSSLISSIESHRLISPYAGWFATGFAGKSAPPVWKQTMIILLVLFPIVMLEMKFLNPLLVNLNRSLGTFIGNAISVALVSWPMMPIATSFLRWWLPPAKEIGWKKNLQGILLILGLYLLEVLIFWHLL